MTADRLRERALQYFKAGWHPLELPERSKGPPPEGRTGYGGSDMTADEIEAAGWMGNIGVRMPADVIGLDVDVYRNGGQALADLLARCGPLPNTWISHSGRDDGSGIRFYRVPPGLTWVAGRAGLDIIQRGHRYSAVAPSIHPDGRAYNWLRQTEGPTTELPVVEDLPELPWPWIGELSRAAQTDAGARSEAVDLTGLEVFVAQHQRADQPGYVGTILAHFTERWRAGYSRHDTMQHCLIWAMECVRAGLAAAWPTLQLFGDLWVEAVSPDARRAELWSDRRTTEFAAMVRHAVGKVVAKPEAEVVKLHDDIAGIPVNAPDRPTDRTDHEPVIDVDHDDDEPPAPRDGLPLPIDWIAFADREEDTRDWLVESFWPWGRAMALWADAKTGKSELVLWCAAKLALGEHPWTGQPVDAVDVMYVDYEMTEDDLDDRLAAFNFDVTRLTRLHYFLLPPLHALDIEKGGIEVERLAARHGARAVVFDTFGRAVAGDENEADTVRDFYRFTGSRLKRLGIGYLRTDHAGKDRARGQRGTSAKRDDVDVIWSMKRADGGGVLLDCTGSSRLSWVQPNLKLDRVAVNGTIAYSSPVRIGWPAGTKRKVEELDACGLPWDISKRKARAALQALGRVPGDNTLLGQAVRFRKERGELFQAAHKSVHGFDSATAHEAAHPSSDPSASP